MILSNRREVLRLILARPESTLDDILKGNCRKLWYLLRCQTELPLQSELFWHERRTHKGWQLIDQHLKFIAVYKVKAQTAKFKIIKNNLLLKGVFTYEVGIFFDKKTSSLSCQPTSLVFSASNTSKNFRLLISPGSNSNASLYPADWIMWSYSM